ncbi:hypothetical protein EJ04DRAFT_530289 [Polyplosphaeria fusca]|uniref:Uncharacterized protein n=1 Tax=Polyplosphaeria fusca TaxID=682080 RepID=A0A9P4QFN5_9PLEO|nr:hypothetical protein EJ04DRAFT_530289 [Polyplosphaeria fusca]
MQGSPPQTPSSQSRAKKRSGQRLNSPSIVEIDSGVSEYETDDAEQNPRAKKGKKGHAEPTQESEKRLRTSGIGYDWVRFETIPGYLADEVHRRRYSVYWLYGSLLRRTRDDTTWFLCKYCHLQTSNNALIKIQNGLSGITNHFRARHNPEYIRIVQIGVTAINPQEGISSLLKVFDPHDPMQQVLHSKTVSIFNKDLLNKKGGV